MRTRGSNKHEHGTMRGKPDLKTRVSRAGIPAYDPKHRQSHSRVSVAGTSFFAIAMIRVHTLVAQKAYAKATRAGEKNDGSGEISHASFESRRMHGGHEVYYSQTRLVLRRAWLLFFGPGRRYITQVTLGLGFMV